MRSSRSSVCPGDPGGYLVKWRRFHDKFDEIMMERCVRYVRYAVYNPIVDYLAGGYDA